MVTTHSTPVSGQIKSLLASATAGRQIAGKSNHVCSPEICGFARAITEVLVPLGRPAPWLAPSTEIPADRPAPGEPGWRRFYSAEEAEEVEEEAKQIRLVNGLYSR